MRLVMATVRRGDRVTWPGFDATEFEILLGSENGNAVARDKPVVATGALGHLAPIAGHDCHGSQVAKMSTKRRMGVLGLDHLYLDYGEPHACQLDIVRSSPQACLHEGRTSQRRDIEHASPSRHSLKGPGH